MEKLLTNAQPCSVIWCESPHSSNQPYDCQYGIDHAIAISHSMGGGGYVHGISRFIWETISNDEANENRVVMEC